MAINKKRGKKKSSILSLIISFLRNLWKKIRYFFIKPKIKKRKRKYIKKKLKLIFRKPSAIKLLKTKKNPIIKPKQENNWEAWQTFNPAVILLDSKVHFLYRAIGTDGISRLGYAMSVDGFEIDERLEYPIYEHNPKQYQFNIHSYFSGGSWGGCEDPRIVRIDNEDKLYITYTACDQGLRVGLNSININDFLNKNWNWNNPKLISEPNKVNKNWVIFPEKINSKYAILHSIKPEIKIDYLDNLNFENPKYIKSEHGGIPKDNEKCWHNFVRGVGPTPIKIDDGWLIFYHAMDNINPGHYKLGAMILDFNNPSKVLYRAQEPILEPSEFYENNGFKPGVVYSSGAIVKDENLLVYYGGADSYVCVAYINFNEFINSIKFGKKIIFKRRKIRRKK